VRSTSIRGAVLAALAASVVSAAASAGGTAPESSTRTATATASITTADAAPVDRAAYVDHATPAAHATTATAPPRLALALALEPLLTDYGLPRHPTTKGLTGVGTIVHAALDAAPFPGVRVLAGARVRLPMTLDFDEELGALPIFAVELTRRLGALDTRLRVGSLEYRRGYHPAIYDETRAGYGRDVERAYASGVVPEARRAFARDPFVPGEHGLELTLGLGPWETRTFLDWQLFETEAHREKFTFGVVSRLDLGRLRASAQLRLDHYGGELYTQSDPLRRAGLDPTRQPTSAALTAELDALAFGPLALRLDAALFGARLAQRGGAAPEAVGGFEAGTRLLVYEALTLGWAYARGLREGVLVLAELGDPTYAMGPVHRVRLALSLPLGPVSVETRFELVFPEQIDSVPYVLATRVVVPLSWALVR
jgi:hypothetical protein